MSFILRDYQQESVDKVIDCYEQFQNVLQSGDEQAIKEARFEMLVLATGAGKTVIFSEIIARLGMPAMVLAHRDDLLNQAMEKFLIVKPGAVVGKVGGKYNDLGGELTVASVASACKPKRLKQLQAFDYKLIVVDEGHHMAAASYQAVLAAFPQAFVLIVTATPDRLDGKPILGKDPLVKRELPDLVRAGYLASPRAIAIKTEVSLDDIKTTAGDFNERELSEAVDTPERNRIIVESWQEHATDRPTIGFCVTIDHAESLAYTFNDYGVSCAVVTGKTSETERLETYARLRSGEIKVLLSIQVLTEGFDEPCVSCIIMARPTKSRSLYVQCVGRGARLHPGKDDFLVLDITDNCLRHRLSPHTFQKALRLTMRDNETMEEELERLEKEAKKKADAEKLVRKLVDKRKEDLAIDLLKTFHWRQGQLGTYHTTFGNGHRMELQPISNNGEWDIPSYDLMAYLSTSAMQEQLWLADVTLSEALQFAEARILKIEADHNAIYLIDKRAPWRSRPVEPESKQAYLAKKLKIQFDEFMTRGQLSDLLDAKFEEREREQRAKKIEEKITKEVERELEVQLV